MLDFLGRLFCRLAGDQEVGRADQSEQPPSSRWRKLCKLQEYDRTLPTTVGEEISKHLKRHSVPPFGHGFGSFGAPCWSLFGSIVRFWQIRAECCRREVRSQKFSVRTLPPDHPHRPSRPKASFINKKIKTIQNRSKTVMIIWATFLIGNYK